MTETPQKSSEFKMQYIVIIACGGVVLIILMGGGIFMYCRAKSNNKKYRARIPDPHHEVMKPMYVDSSTLPPPPASLTSDDDKCSTFGKNSNHTDFIDMMAERRSPTTYILDGEHGKKSPTYLNDRKVRSPYLRDDEHLYHHICDDLTMSSRSPSTEL